MNPSKTQIDRLGERLKKGPLVDSDLILLDKYRQSFSEAYETVFRILSEKPGLEPTGRSAKSTSSIIEKLRRESIRLTQMQDIAGCRVVVPDILALERVVALFVQPVFPEVDVIDRRAHPSHGYRSVHVVVKISGKPVEVQIRTRLQHLWAELSEKCSDVFDSSIKYGGGEDVFQDLLKFTSNSIAQVETLERENYFLQIELQKMDIVIRLHNPNLPLEKIETRDQAWRLIGNIKEEISAANETLATFLNELIRIISLIETFNDPIHYMVALKQEIGVFVKKLKEKISTSERSE